MNGLRQLLAMIMVIVFTTLPANAAKYDIDKKVLKKIRKVAIASVTITSIADQNPANMEFVTQAAEYALSTYSSRVAATGKWQLVEAPGLAGLEEKLANISATPQAREVLAEMADRDKLPGEVSEAMMAKLIMASFRAGTPADLEGIKGEMIEASAREMQEYLAGMRNGLVWPAGFPGIPYGLVDNRKKTGEGLYYAARETFSRILQSYCAEHDLDALLFIHLASDRGEPGDIRIITQGNRILSSFKVNPTMVMRTADGSLGFDYGPPRLDDLAPMKLAMPIYTREKDPEKIRGSIRLDLNDGNGTAHSAYRELIDETAERMLGKLMKKLP